MLRQDVVDGISISGTTTSFIDLIFLHLLNSDVLFEHSTNFCLLNTRQHHPENDLLLRTFHENFKQRMEELFDTNEVITFQSKSIDLICSNSK